MRQIFFECKAVGYKTVQGKCVYALYVAVRPQHDDSEYSSLKDYRMNFITTNAKWVMIISGVLTATMFYGLFAPQSALEGMFGTSFNGELESILVRSWSALVGLIGVILIYGFFNESVRKYSFSIAAFSKLVFVILVFIYGQQFMAKLAPAVIMDIIVIIVAAIYLFNPVSSSKNS